jgi:hypothetical protein
MGQVYQRTDDQRTKKRVVKKMLTNQKDRILNANKKAKVLPNIVDNKRGIFVFPCLWTNGYVNISNLGILPDYPRPKAGDFTFFQKV